LTTFCKTEHSKQTLAAELAAWKKLDEKIAASEAMNVTLENSSLQFTSNRDQADLLDE